MQADINRTEVTNNIFAKRNTTSVQIFRKKALSKNITLKSIIIIGAYIQLYVESLSEKFLINLCILVTYHIAGIWISERENIYHSRS